MEREVVLSVKDLKTYFYLPHGVLKAVDGVSFDVHAGELVGLVGESGCGKSITARSILNMVRNPGKPMGEVWFYRDGAGVNLLELGPDSPELRRIRGDALTMIFQEPMNAFSMVHTVGHQIMEGILLHRKVNKAEARRQALQLLEQVGIANPSQRIDEYPFQLSGGMRQRAMIAMAIATNPKVLICDEPTTALDVSVQAQILSLLKDLQRQNGMAIIFITHDLAVISQIAHRVIVMYLGKIVEAASVRDIFKNPQHPYTVKLMAAVPDVALAKGIEHKRLQTIEGFVPEPIGLPDQCLFYRRCSEAFERCETGMPQLVAVGSDHFVRCFKFGDPGRV
ncbi:MAG: peptide/nickel transport system ATP-binding protein [Chloroflexota bacterium]|nr:peptide/nickel transport system ATP-binding protein [Chloroflexota bacterium]